MLTGEDVRNFIHATFNVRSTLFRGHQKRQLQRFQHFFDSVESQPLTELQRRAIILDERRNLVVAGAGTGKTSVIVAKAGYLIETGKCRPDEILLLAFNRDAAKELSARCKDRLGVDIRASTFHALGNEIVRSVEPVAPTLSRLAQDQQYFNRFLDSAIEDLIADKALWRKSRSFILGHLVPYRPESEFRTLADYTAYIRSVELRALSGDLVKSLAELDIANFLFVSGVNFEYEKRYPREATRYHPDFYLTDYDIWLEHFGIDRKGNTAPFIDRERYQREMEWKRGIHARNNTTLLETYTWHQSEGVLTRRLNDLLKNHGVTYAPRSQEDILKALQDARYTTQLAVLVAAFLTHFKSSQMPLSELRRKAKHSSNGRRSKAFVDLFEFLLAKYQSALDSKNPREIDFNDMISAATQYVQKDHFAVPWKYIIVDEFQDISVGRYLLLKAMLKRRVDLRLFAVGDDWQSIYRFAGSDIAIMSRFRKFFGRATIVQLDQTFRFNDRIASVSGQFIQKNPQQIRKSLKTEVKCESPQVCLHWVDSQGGSRQAYDDALEGVVHEMKEKIRREGLSLLILARYNHLLPDRTSLNALANAWPGQIKSPMTVHRAKGLEADYVIVTGLTADRYAFPSEVEDDPLLNLVLAKPESYAHAEERRLFYVALTRARHQVHLLVDRTNPSPFALELLNGSYDVRNIGRSLKDRNLCPECGSGLIEEKRPGFAACSNIPYCAYVAPTCSDCGNGFMLVLDVDSLRQYQCTSESCWGTAAVCPQCRIGALVRQPAKYGNRLACHTSPRCNHIENRQQGNREGKRGR